MDKGGTQCGGDEDTHRGERREMLRDGGTKWGYGGDGDGVMEGVRHRERNKDVGTWGHRGMDLRERR